jgi:uncharacterized membrane protein required for colicin V production
MMSLAFAFWMLVLLFAVIGAMRGWAKELLVTFSVVLALFLLQVIGRYVPPVRDFLDAQGNSSAAFWIRATVVILMVFFGYQTVNLPRIAGARFARERLSDVLLGLVLGALNGFLIVSSIWFFMEDSGYPFRYIIAPDPNNPISAPALRILPYLAPRWLGIPAIYFAVAIAFIFVLVVFI